MCVFFCVVVRLLVSLQKAWKVLPKFTAFNGREVTVSADNDDDDDGDADNDGDDDGDDDQL